jgi:hypothetical protein
MDCQSFDGLPSETVLNCRLSSKGRQRRISTKRASAPSKTIKEKEEIDGSVFASMNGKANSTKL